MVQLIGSKRTTIILAITLLFILLFGYSLARLTVLAQPPQPEQAKATERLSGRRIVYLVSADVNQVEEALSADALLADKALLEKHDFAIQPTSDWQPIAELALAHKLDVLIIHHSALPLVNADEIKKLLRQDIIIAGIGIPGLELAELVGEPTLFTSTWATNEGYTTQHYFYIYSYAVQGDTVEIGRLGESGWQLGDDPLESIEVQKPLSINAGASTDTLLGKDFSTMFSLLDGHLLGVTSRGESAIVPVEPLNSE